MDVRSLVLKMVESLPSITELWQTVTKKLSAALPDGVRGMKRGLEVDDR